MNKQFQNNLGEEGEHPTREMLLLCADGELPQKEAARLQAHLEACWHCRVKTKKIEEAIADIIEFDEQVLKPHLVPPQGWRNFDRQLSHLAAGSGQRSLLSKVFGTFGRFLSTAWLSLLPRPLVRVTAGLLVAVLIVALVIHFKQEPVASASELLEKAAEAQTARLSATSEPVMHQKIQVRRRTGQALAREVAVGWEIWNDTRNSRVRHFIMDGSGSPSVDLAVARNDRTEEFAGAPLINELAQVLEANHMDPRRPLSAASYQSWRNTLAQKQDEVTRSKLSNGLDAVTLRTTPAGHVKVGQIAEAVFVVRARDWQPTELRLSVEAEGGDRSYELIEVTSEVMPLARVDPAIFAREEVASAPVPKAAPPAPTPTPSPAVKLNSVPLPLVVEPARPVATADLEVEALRLLNGVGADLGEQISVKRTNDEMLQITGVVETDKRKAEITGALGTIAGNPAVRVEIQTVAEALRAQQRSQTKASPPPATEQKVEIQSGSMAAEDELRSYFNSESEARQFASQMVAGSQQAMRHLYALKRLSQQFSTEELRALSPEARSKLLSLIRAHARAYQQGVAGLKRGLRPIFFPTASQGGAAVGPEITDLDGVVETIERLFELGSANDRVILSAFTTSAEGANVTAIKTGAFWQSLNNAEALSARIQSAR